MIQEKELKNKKARVEEFWHKFFTEKLESDAVSFFGGTNIKNEDTPISFRVALNAGQVNKINQLCNNSDVLIYNYYFCALSILLQKYENKFCILSPVNQFDKFSQSKGLFILNPTLDPTQSFKTFFSNSKEDLIKSIEFAFDMDAFNDSFLNIDYFHKNNHFALTINKTDEMVSEISKTLFCFELDNEYPYLEINMKGEMYDQKSLTLFGENFNELVNEILLKTYEPIESLGYIGASERNILNTINQPKTNFPLDRDIVELLNNQCIQQKEKIAILHGNESISYEQLLIQTNALSAHVLKVTQAKKDDLFGVMLSRSINMVKGILSVWKAGSAYVPIAKNIADDALLHIIQNSNLKAILTDDVEVIEQLNRLSIAIPIINLQETNYGSESKVEPVESQKLDTSSLAYVIYTSGSTGIPKGAMIEHFGMLNHIGAKIEEMSINSDSIVAQNAPHTFDISIWQFFAPLVAGGTSVIYDDEMVTDVNEFVKKMVEDKVTLLELVPSYLIEILNYIEKEKEQVNLALNTIILNAETLTKTMVKRWLDLFPNVPIINTYGATEVSDDISHYFMYEVPESYSVPVMKNPIQNFEVHIVNERKQRVPIGVAGELLLTGPCVGRGYFNDDEKTKDAYLTGPIAGISNDKRIYKTGDLGKFMPDGTLEFIGRNDNQVKILGHRIELDAIENVTSQIEGIINSKAIAFTDKQVIGLYYVSENEIDKNTIESELLKKLPKYMIPSFYVHMESFPLTKNGKINKKLLPNPNDFKRAYQSPETETEIKIVNLWEDILNVQDIGVSDNFFDLGGNSLKLMRLRNEYQKLFNVKINLKDFFSNTTIISHIELISKTELEYYEKIEKVNEGNNYPVSYGQSRLWVLSQFEGASSAYNMPNNITINGEYDVTILRNAIYSTIKRHEVLRTVFIMNDEGELRQSIHPIDDFNFELNYIDYSHKKEKYEEVNAYIQNDSFLQFDLENGPLFRIALFKISDNEHVFYYNIHHIIGDGWSNKVLLKDVFEFYDAYKKGTEPNLAELKIQYKDYVLWEKENEQKPEFENHKNYWINTLSGNLPLLDLPGQKIRPTQRKYNGHTLGTYISFEKTKALKAFCAQQGGSLFMGVLAVWNILFYKYTSMTDFILGTPVAGRDHADLKDQIGFYMNILALRNKINPQNNFIETFQQVKEGMIKNHEHQSYPFDLLIDNLKIDRRLDRNPIYDVMISFHNIFDLHRDQEEIEEEVIIDFGEEKSKLDMLINITDFEETILINLNYDSDLYHQDTIKKLIKDYLLVLDKLLQDPSSSLELLNYQSDSAQNAKKNNLLKLMNFKR